MSQLELEVYTININKLIPHKWKGAYSIELSSYLALGAGGPRGFPGALLA